MAATRFAKRDDLALPPQSRNHCRTESLHSEAGRDRLRRVMNELNEASLVRNDIQHSRFDDAETLSGSPEIIRIGATGNDE